MLLMDDNEISFLFHNVLFRIYMLSYFISVMLQFNLGKHLYTCFTDEKLRGRMLKEKSSMVKSADFAVR